MGISGSYHYPVAQSVYSSYQSVVMREQSPLPAAATGLGQLAVDESGDFYFVDSSGGVNAIVVSSGSVAVVSGTLEVAGQLYSVITDALTPAGTTQTIDFDTGNSHVVDLADATGDVTLTLSNAQAGGSYVIKVIQDAAVARNLIWPASVLWLNGVTPTVSAGALAVDMFTLFYDGTNFLGNVGSNYS